MGAKSKLIGKRFSKLFVICEYIPSEKTKDIMWLCLCDCGNNKYVVSSYHLNSGKVKSCGRCGEFLDLTGKKFERWTIICKAQSHVTRKGNVWHCKCTCGNKKNVHQQDLFAGHSKSCGCYKK